MCRTLSDKERNWLVKYSKAEMEIDDEGNINLYAVFDGTNEKLASEYILRFGEFVIHESWGAYN